MLSGLLVAVSALLAAASVLPYEWVRLWLDRFAADGSADAYTRAIHLAIAGRLRYVGIGLLGLGAVGYGARGWLVTAGRRFWVAAGALLRDLGPRLRRLMSEEPASYRVTSRSCRGSVARRLWALPIGGTTQLVVAATPNRRPPRESSSSLATSGVASTDRAALCAMLA
jgi:hypothetical protein